MTESATVDQPVQGQPEAPARALSAALFLDPSMVEAEKAAIFERTWQLAGHTAALPAPGRYLTMDVGSEPVLVLRDDAGWGSRCRFATSPRATAPSGSTRASCARCRDCTRRIGGSGATSSSTPTSRSTCAPVATPLTRAVQRMNHRLNSRVLEEDVDLVRNVQAGLATRGFRPGPLSRREAGVAWFADRVRGDLGRGRGAGADPGAADPAGARL